MGIEQPLTPEAVVRAAGLGASGSMLPDSDRIRALKEFASHQDDRIAITALRCLGAVGGQDGIRILKEKLFLAPNLSLARVIVQSIVRYGNHADLTFIRKLGEKLPREAHRAPIDLKKLVQGELCVLRSRFSENILHGTAPERSALREGARALWPRDFSSVTPSDSVVVTTLRRRIAQGGEDESIASVIELAMNFDRMGVEALRSLTRDVLTGLVSSERVVSSLRGARDALQGETLDSGANGGLAFIEDMLTVLEREPKPSIDQGAAELVEREARRVFQEIVTRKSFADDRLVELGAVLGKEVIPPLYGFCANGAPPTPAICSALLATRTSEGVDACAQLAVEGSSIAQKAIHAAIRKEEEPRFAALLRDGYWKAPEVDFILRNAGAVRHLFDERHTGERFALRVLEDRGRPVSEMYHALRAMQLNRLIGMYDPDPNSTEDSNRLVMPMRVLFDRCTEEVIRAFPVKAEIDAENIGRLLFEEILLGRMEGRGRVVLHRMIEVFRSSGLCRSQLIACASGVTDTRDFALLMDAFSDRLGAEGLRQLAEVPCTPPNGAALILRLRSMGQFQLFEETVARLRRGSYGDSMEAQYARQLLAVIRGNEEEIRRTIAEQLGLEDPLGPEWRPEGYDNRDR